MQSTARKNELPLDRMSLACEVTKKSKDELTGPPRDGANIHGLFMEGARYVWRRCLLPPFYVRVNFQDVDDT